jgi:MFS family permease
MWGISALIGPALGAVLTATVGWRWVFWINLPLIACVAWSAARALRVIHPPKRPARDAPLNIVGPALLGLVVAVLLALTKHWLPPLALAPVALVPAVAFVLHERRTSQPVFTHTPNSIAANLAAFGAGVAFLGAETYLPLQLQVGFDDGVRVVGLALLLCTLGWTTGSMTAARLGARPRNQIALGTGLTVAATFVMAIPAGGAALPIAAYTLSGLGMGIASPALFAAVLADGAKGREGQSTSSIPLARQVGSGMGAAIAGIVFAAALTSAQVHHAERAGAHVPAVVDAARLTYLGAAVVGLLGLAACLWLRGDARTARAEHAMVEPEAVT